MALPEQTPRKRQYDGQIKAQVSDAVSGHPCLQHTNFSSEARLHYAIKGSVSPVTLITVLQTVVIDVIDLTNSDEVS
jgi:hypothetical protein